jgi:hypothetical protein
MKVTNNTPNAMHLAGVLIAAGATENVPDYDTVKDSYPVQQFLKAEAISVAKPAKKTAADSEAEERAALFAELDKLKVTYDKTAKTPALLVALEDAKKAAGQ